MATTIDKIIKSSTAPINKNCLWDNGYDLMIYRNGRWEKVVKPMTEEVIKRLEALEQIVL